MKAVSIKKLVKKLSSLGLESLENLYTKNKAPQSQHIGSLCNALLHLKGEASSVAIAEEILSIYGQFDAGEKLEFFRFLQTELNADDEKVQEAISRFQAKPDPQTVQALNKASESPRLDLFRALNMAPTGTRSLLTMRADILDALLDNPDLKLVDDDLLHLFRSWFNRGFLDIKRIDWQTPAVVLEKLIDYESVHEIKGWPDLRRRLEEDRRCFGFFHPVMPYEPLIFVEVALTYEISHNITELLHQTADHSEDDAYSTAIFYSINNCLEGLRGVSFGNLLIKQVVEKLEKEISSIATYATLSPVPNLIKWLESSYQKLGFLSDEEREKLAQFLDNPMPTQLADLDLHKTMMSLCAYYLLKVKSRDKPACPVARFHLGNGASLLAINWLADVTENGMQQSAGIMVNYLYEKTTLAQNHEVYERDDAVVCSANVRKLLPSSSKTQAKKIRSPA